MKIQIRQLKEALKHIKPRTLLFSLTLLLITAAVAIYAGVQTHTMQKDNLLLRGRLNTREATMEYNRRLLTRVDIVTMVANTVEYLMETGESSAVIEQYLTNQTNSIIQRLDPDTTGLYGLFNGEYLDGSGWEPEADYVPTERPWYTETLKSGREITFVDPYLDAQTNTVMITVSKLLSDGESVLAMDVSLSSIQAIIAQVSDSAKGGQAFLLDEEGTVISHSDENQLGRNYLKEPYTLGGMIARKVLSEGLRQFEIDTPEGKYVVYADGLEGGWYSVSLINSDIWHRPLHRTMLIFSVILVLVVLCVFAIILHLTAKNYSLLELHNQVAEEHKKGARLRALSETDRMTGLNDRVNGERKVTALTDAGCGGMFLELDIDHFKAINDTYGHQTGDRVIIAIANALQSAFRTNDVLMRLGGDEFGVFAVGIADRDMGTAIIHRLFHQLEGVAIPGMREKVCVSVGAALTPEGEKPAFNELYGLADQALYASKKAAGSSLTFSENKA